MTPKRPRDPNQLAKSIMDIATGDKPDRDPTPEEQGKSAVAVATGTGEGNCAQPRCPLRAGKRLPKRPPKLDGERALR